MKTRFALALLLCASLSAQEKASAPTAPEVFDRLKALAGNWSATMMAPDGQATRVEYRVTAAGSVVMETMFAGTDHEMINMYTVDGEELIATHYCAAGNQPTLKLNRAKSTKDELIFDFSSVRGPTSKGYIDGVTMKFAADGTPVESWSHSGENPPLNLYFKARSK